MHLFRPAAKESMDKEQEKWKQAVEHLKDTRSDGSTRSPRKRKIDRKRCLKSWKSALKLSTNIDESRGYLRRTETRASTRFLQSQFSLVNLSSFPFSFFLSYLIEEGEVTVQRMEAKDSIQCSCKINTTSSTNEACTCCWCKDYWNH
ncbi:uncharacterized protein J3R85_016288 [Psidium guajava]|nr:uncharacterized protein J3R85_016288 [Psidium guajava]